MLAHNRALTAMLIEMVDDLGFQLATPRPEHRRGGSIMVSLPDNIVAGDLLGDLKKQAVFADARGQTLRLSPGVVTTQQGVDKLAQCLRQRSMQKT